MQGGYLTVFDFLERSYPVWPTIFGTMAIIAGVGIYFERKKMMPRRSPEMQVRISAFFLTASILWTTITTYIVFDEYMQITRAIEANKIRAVEGYVTKFVPLIDQMSAWEKFCVGEACFHYSDFVPSAGFNNTAKYGGPVREGAYVRLIYVDNLILKLQVMQ